MKHLIFAALILIAQHCYSQSSISMTYTSGDIPTSLTNYDPACNGPLTTIDIILPSALGTYEITGIDINYSMTALGSGYISDQRSYIHCQTTNTSEAQVYSGTTSASGTQPYIRNNIDIANGDYFNGETISFEMRAWRTFGNTGVNCNTNYNKVDNNTWSITIHYLFCPSMTELNTQADVDAFVSNYGHCSKLEGILIVGSSSTISSDIVDVSGLNFLDSIFSLEFIDNPMLTEINLPQLNYAFNLNISENGLLNSMSMTNLTSVDFFSFTNNEIITQLSLPIDTCYRDINVYDNVNLETLAFPEMVRTESITLGFGIAEEESLINLDLNKLESCQVFRMERLPIITSISLPELVNVVDLLINDNTLTGSSIQSISVPKLENAGKIEITEMDNLSTLDFSSLRFVTNELRVDASGNSTLLEMNSLKQLRFAGEIEITGFDSLNDCCFFHYFLPDVSNKITLNNGPDCDDFFQLESICQNVDPDGDGIYGNVADNCPDIYNPKQEDFDEDGVGNACDNCPTVINTDQADANDNFIGDACEQAELGKVGVNTSTPKAGLELEASDLYLNDANRGLIMRNPLGECYRIKVNLDGELQLKAISCPN